VSGQARGEQGRLGLAAAEVTRAGSIMNVHLDSPAARPICT